MGRSCSVNGSNAYKLLVKNLEWKRPRGGPRDRIILKWTLEKQGTKV